MRQVSLSGGIPLDNLILEKPNLSNTLKETYVHPKLVTSITLWASPKFYIMVNEIVTNFFIQKIINEKQAIIDEQKETIKEKDDKIDELIKLSKKSSAKIDKLLDENAKVQDKLAELGDDNYRMILKMNKMFSMLKKKSDTHVRLTGKEGHEHNILVVIETNCELQKSKYSKFFGKYYIMRLMRNSLATQLNRFRMRHPMMHINKTINVKKFEIIKR